MKRERERDWERGACKLNGRPQEKTSIPDLSNLDFINSQFDSILLLWLLLLFTCRPLYIYISTLDRRFDSDGI